MTLMIRLHIYYFQSFCENTIHWAGICLHCQMRMIFVCNCVCVWGGSVRLPFSLRIYFAFVELFFHPCIKQIHSYYSLCLERLYRSRRRFNFLIKNNILPLYIVIITEREVQFHHEESIIIIIIIIIVGSGCCRLPLAACFNHCRILCVYAAYFPSSSIFHLFLDFVVAFFLFFSFARSFFLSLSISFFFFAVAFSHHFIFLLILFSFVVILIFLHFSLLFLE